MSRSAYGEIKRAQIIGALPPEEQQELEDLEAKKPRTVAQEARIHELWQKGVRDHVAPRMDPLFDYAKEIGDRMWEKRYASE